MTHHEDHPARHRADGPVDATHGGDADDRYDEGQAAVVAGGDEENRFDEGQAPTADIVDDLPENRYDEGQAPLSDAEAAAPEGRFDEGQGSTYGVSDTPTSEDVEPRHRDD